MKKFLSLFIVLALVFSTAVMPVLAEEVTEPEATPTPEYYLKGIYDNATVVLSQEPTRTVTLVDIANVNALSEAATNVSKVVFTFNGVETEDSDAPFSYTMEFSATGTQTLKYDVYKTGNETETPDESDTITFNVVKGTKNAASFTEDFEGTFANDAAAVASIITSYDPERAAIKKVDLNGRNVLEIDPIGSRTTDVIFKSDNATAGHKVCYYEFDMQTLYSYASYFRVIGSAHDTLFSTQSGTRGIDKDPGYYIFTRGTWRKIGVVLDYNYQDGGAPTATVYIDGKEYKRVPLTNVAGSTSPVFGIRVDNLADNIYIDNFKYAVYDKIVEGATPTYFVKGIYNGAVVVAQQEESRQITVVDNANNGALLNSATNISKVEFYKDDALVATDDVVPFTYDLKFDSYGAHKFQAKIYDVHGNIYNDFVSNYKVVAGTKNNEASFEEDFEGTFADDAAAAASIITSYDSERAAIKKVDLNGRNVLEIDPIGSKGTDVIFKSDNATAGHKVCYYEFDMQTHYSYASYFRVTGSAHDTLFTTQNGTRGIDKDSGYYIFTRGTWRKIGVVLDYNYQDGGAPTATVYIDGKEYKRVPLTNVAGSTNPVFGIRVDNLGDNIYIDNFKYAVYDAYENFGLNDFQNEIIFENHGTEEEPSYTTVCGFEISASNSTNAPVTVRNFFVAYDGDGRLLNIYSPDHEMWKDGTNANITYTFQPGVYDQKFVLRCGVDDPRGRSAKVFTYVMDAETGSIDFAPIADFD